MVGCFIRWGAYELGAILKKWEFYVFKFAFLWYYLFSV